MGLELEDIVPWGRSLQEYRRMFALTDADLQRTILDCAAGPASFNGEMTALGHSVLSCDPIYQFSPQEIDQRIQETKAIILDGVKASLDSYIWTTFSSPEDLCEARLTTMRTFLSDLPKGLEEGRYQTATLPDLPCKSRSFDLALCSHFLFSYSDHLSLDFHWQAIQEMLRVADEVRIFPLMTLSGEVSPFLSQIMMFIGQEANLQALIQTVDYEFQKDGNQLLTIRVSRT